MKLTVGCKYHDKDGFLFFKSITGEKGHIILHMVESVLLNTETNEITITGLYDEYPKLIVKEMYINLNSDFFEVTIEPISKNYQRISCKLVKDVKKYG